MISGFMFGIPVMFSQADVFMSSQDSVYLPPSFCESFLMVSRCMQSTCSIWILLPRNISSLFLNQRTFFGLGMENSASRVTGPSSSLALMSSRGTIYTGTASCFFSLCCSVGQSGITYKLALPKIVLSS